MRPQAPDLGGKRVDYPQLQGPGRSNPIASVLAAPLLWRSHALTEEEAMHQGRQVRALRRRIQ